MKKLENLGALGLPRDVFSQKKVEGKTTIGICCNVSPEEQRVASEGYIAFLSLILGVFTPRPNTKTP